MEYVTLGRTGLKVSVSGLGCGGFSRLGLGAGNSENHAITLIRDALELGVNFFDTAESYGTEGVLGKALKSVPRDRVVISSKGVVVRDGVRRDAAAIAAAVDGSLRRLETDYIDVYQLHGVDPQDYGYAMDVAVPVLLDLQRKGKIRHLGLSEVAMTDHTHEMLARAVDSTVWSVMMLAFNMMHQNARTLLFPRTIKNGVGTLMMFVVRNIFSKPERLREEMEKLSASGQWPKELAGKDAPLDFLVHAGGASSLTDAAYRYVRYEPGANVVLFGTGSREHLKTNVESILKPPLPQGDIEKINRLFGHLVGSGLDGPKLRKP